MSIEVKEIHSFLKEMSGELRELSRKIWEHPELAWNEKYAARTLCDFLREKGFQPQENYLDLPTSFRAEFGSAGHTFAVAAEYDALPEVGHGCGHNLIATAAIAATLVVRKFMNDRAIPGKFVLLGTPAEESGGGKVVMLERGCLQNVDAVMMVHPTWRNSPDPGSTAVVRYDIEFEGVAAHAAGMPELGINALDAVMLLFAGVNAYRQQLPSDASIHGIVTKGGDMPNIIPAHTSCRFYLRSMREEGITDLEQRFQNMVKGAALMTGCKYKLIEISKRYRTRRPNAAMNALYMDDMEALGNTVCRDVKTGKGSSDFGDFSHVCPGIHSYFAVADHEVAGHSLAMTQASNSDLGFESMLCAASSMAHIALKFLSDDAFAAKVTDGFVAD